MTVGVIFIVLSALALLWIFLGAIAYVYLEENAPEYVSGKGMGDFRNAWPYVICRYWRNEC